MSWKSEALPALPAYRPGYSGMLPIKEKKTPSDLEPAITAAKRKIGEYPSSLTMTPATGPEIPSDKSTKAV